MSVVLHPMWPAPAKTTEVTAPLQLLDRYPGLEHSLEAIEWLASCRPPIGLRESTTWLEVQHPAGSRYLIAWSGGIVMAPTAERARRLLRLMLTLTRRDLPGAPAAALDGQHGRMIAPLLALELAPRESSAPMNRASGG